MDGGPHSSGTKSVSWNILTKQKLKKKIIACHLSKQFVLVFTRIYFYYYYVVKFTLMIIIRLPSYSIVAVVNLLYILCTVP